MIALRASVGVGPGQLTIMLPDFAPRNDEQSLEMLLAMKAPIVCVATLLQKRFHVAAWPEATSYSLAADLWREAAEEGRFPSDPQALTDANAIIIRGVGEECRLSFMDCDQWFQDYRLPYLTIVARAPAETDSGARLVLVISGDNQSTLNSR